MEPSVNSLAAGSCLLCGGTAHRELHVRGNGCVWRECRGCGLWVNLTPPADDLADHYDTAYHEAHYGAERRRKALTARLLVRQIEGLCHRRGLTERTVLDIGCSLGHFVQAAAAAGWDAWGVDVGPAVIAQCRREGLQVQVAGMGHLPFADNRFAVVQARHVLEHDLQVRHNLTEMKRVLQPGGLLVIEVPDCASPKVVRRGDRYSKFWTPDHVVGFTPATLARFAAEVGLQPVPYAPLSGLREGHSGSAARFFAWRVAQLARQAAGSAKAFLTVWTKPVEERL